MNTTLLKAAKLLETIGWCQGDVAKYKYSHDGTNVTPIAYCAVGAINKAGGLTNRHGLIHRATIKLMKYLIQTNQVARCGNIVSWNDSPTQTKQNVINTITKAAHAKLPKETK